MIVYRLTEDSRGIPEGACISEERYKKIYYSDKCLFEPITEESMPEMIKHVDDSLQAEFGIEFFLFYDKEDLHNFITKKYEHRAN